MKKLFILAVSALMLSGFASARQLTPAESLARFSDSKTITIGNDQARRAPASQLDLVYTSQHTFGNSFYAYNLSNSNGFIILSADDNMPTLLGYCDNGSFDFDNLPSNLKWMLSAYDAIAMQCVTNNVRMVTRAASDWKAINPLLGSIIWDQSEPFNNNCPTYEGEKTLTGCVATAMAQVMKYYNWPDKGVGRRSYEYDLEIDEEYVYPMEITNYSFEHTLDWGNMLNNYSGSYNSAQAKAVATLMMDCGVAAMMTWGLEAAGGSGAVNEDAVEGMVKYMKYDSGMKLAKQSDYTQSKWNELIYNELSSERPVILGGCGETGEGGHEFVCDGYSKDGYYHINWGWSGSCNGYFILSGSGLVPEETGSGGADAGDSYGYELEAIIGIQPVGWTPSGIEEINTDQSTLPTYNLNGIPQNQNNKSLHGIFIQNGQKVIK